MTASQSEINFVRLLSKGTKIKEIREGLIISGANKPLQIDKAKVQSLLSQGVIEYRGRQLTLRPEGKVWLRRNLLKQSAAKQNEKQSKQPSKEAGTQKCELEHQNTPFARIAVSVEGGAPFLQPFQIDAAQRFERLFERAHLNERVTMSYQEQVGGSSAGKADLTDMVANARDEIARLLTQMPQDPSSALLNIVGYQIGVQRLEQEKHWPRRSGKMMLRVALDILATRWGLADSAMGERGKTTNWRNVGRPTSLR